MSRPVTEKAASIPSILSLGVAFWLLFIEFSQSGETGHC